MTGPDQSAKLRDLSLRCGSAEWVLNQLANGYTAAAEADLAETVKDLESIVSELNALRDAS